MNLGPLEEQPELFIAKPSISAAPTPTPMRCLSKQNMEFPPWSTYSSGAVDGNALQCDLEGIACAAQMGFKV